MAIKLLDGHLTQRQKEILEVMLSKGLMQGGTKKIQFQITSLGKGKYQIKRWEYYALSTRQFDLRPESGKPKWHFEGTITIEHK